MSGQVMVMEEGFMNTLIERIVDLISIRIDANTLWTSQQCSSYFGVGSRHFVDRISKTFGFPAAVRLPSENGRGHARWYAMEIIEWARRHRES